MSAEFSIKRYNQDYYRLICFKYGKPRKKIKKEEYTYKKDVQATSFEFGNLYYLYDENNNPVMKDDIFTTKHQPLKVTRDKNDKKLENNLSRARSKVFEYALCNDFKYFVTLTLDKNKYNRYDLKKFIKDLGKLIQNHFNRKKIEFKYILIPEMHKDGAWHLHGLFTEIPQQYLSINKNGYLDFKLYSDRFGYCSLGEIKDKVKCATYITKYITKEMGDNIEKNHKSYYCSRGLKTAETIFTGNLDSNIQYDFQNDFVCIKNLTEKDFCTFINNYKF